AAQNTRPEHIKKLQEIVDQERAAGGDRRRMMELDFEFQTEIARASGNLFAQLLYNSLKPVYMMLSAKFFDAIPDPQQVPVNAQVVIELLKARDGDNLVRNTRYFLEMVNEFMLRELSVAPEPSDETIVC